MCLEYRNVNIRKKSTEKEKNRDKLMKDQKLWRTVVCIDRKEGRK